MNLKRLNSKKAVAVAYVLLGGIFALIFYFNVVFPESFQEYFKQSYYQQFGPIAISLELFIAGIYLLKGHKKSNFLLALFAFSAFFGPVIQPDRTFHEPRTNLRRDSVLTMCHRSHMDSTH